MPGYPNSRTPAFCCIPSSSVPPPRDCGCTTSGSTALIPQKVTVSITRVYRPPSAECDLCTNLNGSYVLWPSSRGWGTTHCYFEKSFTLHTSKSSRSSDLICVENCTDTLFTLLAKLDSNPGTTNARWEVRLFHENAFGSSYYPLFLWKWRTRNQSPVPVPWSYPCLGTTESTYFENSWYPIITAPNPPPCHAAWSSTSWDQTTDFDMTVPIFDIKLATDYYGYGMNFPLVTIDPSSST